MARKTQAQWDAERAEVKAQAAITIAEQAEEAKRKLAEFKGLPVAKTAEVEVESEDTEGQEPDESEDNENA